MRSSSRAAYAIAGCGTVAHKSTETTQAPAQASTTASRPADLTHNASAPPRKPATTIRTAPTPDPTTPPSANFTCPEDYYPAITVERRTTSCPFAVNVFRAFAAADSRGEDPHPDLGVILSPTTSQNYEVSCRAQRTVTCTDSTGAFIQFVLSDATQWAVNQSNASVYTTSTTTTTTVNAPDPALCQSLYNQWLYGTDPGAAQAAIQEYGELDCQP